jgi:hypothetical protein
MSPSARAAVHVQSLQVAHGLLESAFAKQDLTNAQLVHTLGASGTHILWSLGHLVWAYDFAMATALGLKPQCPPRYHELFAFSTHPAKDVAVYPPMAEMHRLANEGLARVCARMATLADAELAAPVPSDHPLAAYFPSLDHFLSMGAIHTGYHIGQVSLLRVAQGMPGLMGA